MESEEVTVLRRKPAANRGRKRRVKRAVSFRSPVDGSPVDADFAQFTARMNQLAEGQKLLAIAGDRANSLYVRLSALDEYGRRFDPTIMEKLRASWLVEEAWRLFLIEAPRYKPS